MYKETGCFRSVRKTAKSNSDSTRRIFMKFDIFIFFENIFQEKSRFIKIWQE
jgi:hypothetical protein